MRIREIRTDGKRTIVAVADKGDEAMAVIREAVQQHRVRGAQVTAVGAFQSAELGYFDRDRRDYLPIPVTEQVEVLSLVGDIADHNGSPAIHLHVVLGRRDGSTVGGHLLRAEVWPTLEVIITEVGADLVKQTDPETGLALLPAQPDPQTHS